jgi:hypothetical protein
VVGISTEAARADHKHDITTAVATSAAIDDVAAEGSSTSLARADHKHSLTGGTPVTLGTVNATGSNTTFSRSDHVHAHGAQSDGTLHAVVNNTTNGFVPAVGGAGTLAVSNGTNIFWTALTDGYHGNRGGGSLHAAVTNAANGFATALGGANTFAVSNGSVMQWVAMSDGYHGARGGGTQHTIATSSAAGFVPQTTATRVMLSDGSGTPFWGQLSDGYVASNFSLMIAQSFSLASVSVININVGTGTWAVIWVAPKNMTITTMSCQVATTGTGNVFFAIYSEALSRLAQDTTGTSVAAQGIVTASLDSPLAVTRGTRYYLAIRTDAGPSRYTGTTCSNTAQIPAYSITNNTTPSFPATFTVNARQASALWVQVSE